MYDIYILRRKWKKKSETSNKYYENESKEEEEEGWIHMSSGGLHLVLVLLLVGPVGIPMYFYT